MKKQDFRVMSLGEKCSCGKPIKANVSQRKEKSVKLCYKCHIEHEALGGHIMMGKKGLVPGPTFKRNIMMGV